MKRRTGTGELVGCEKKYELREKLELLKVGQIFFSRIEQQSNGIYAKIIFQNSG